MSEWTFFWEPSFHVQDQLAFYFFEPFFVWAATHAQLWVYYILWFFTFKILCFCIDLSCLFMVLLPDFMPFLCFFYFTCSSTTWNTNTVEKYLQRKNAGSRVGCEGAWMFWVRLILLTRGPEEPLPSVLRILTPDPYLWLTDPNPRGPKFRIRNTPLDNIFSSQMGCVPCAWYREGVWRAPPGCVSWSGCSRAVPPGVRRPPRPPPLPPPPTVASRPQSL